VAGRLQPQVGAIQALVFVPGVRGFDQELQYFEQNALQPLTQGESPHPRKFINLRDQPAKQLMAVLDDLWRLAQRDTDPLEQKRVKRKKNKGL
jgi:hypothetical protein